MRDDLVVSRPPQPREPLPKPHGNFRLVLFGLPQTGYDRGAPAGRRVEVRAVRVVRGAVAGGSAYWEDRGGKVHGGAAGRVVGKTHGGAAGRVVAVFVGIVGIRPQGVPESDRVPFQGVRQRVSVRREVRRGGAPRGPPSEERRRGASVGFIC